MNKTMRYRRPRHEITIAQFQGGKVRPGVSALRWVPMRIKRDIKATGRKEMFAKEPGEPFL